jgi:hypothetical protein
VNQSEIDQIEQLLRGVIPDLLKQLGWRDASKAMRRLPSIRHDLQRLARMPHMLEEMRGKVAHTQKRVKSFEVRQFDTRLRSQFEHYHEELGAFANVLVGTKKLVENYLAKHSRAAANDA